MPAACSGPVHTAADRTPDGRGPQSERKVDTESEPQDAVGTSVSPWGWTMNLVATILIIGASGHAERSMETDETIAGIVVQCAWGAVSDALHNSQRGIDLGGAAIKRPTLQIDGEPRTGWRAWTEGAVRVGVYAIDARDTGSVGYQYRFRVRGYNVRRVTTIQDGHVLLTTDVWWTETVVIPLPPFLQRLLKKKAIIRKVPIHVCIPIRADEESDGATRIVGTATGTADTRQFCLRRVAERQASEQLNAELRNALAEIEQRGRIAYASGEGIADVLDGIHFGIKIGGVVGRLRR